MVLREDELLEDTLDQGLKTLAKVPLRTCIVTRQVVPQEQLLRFVLSPENQLVADLLLKLPGRGAWVTCNAPTLLQAFKKNLFARAFKTQVQIPEGFMEKLIAHMQTNVLAAIALANRSGLAIAGAFKVQKTIEQEQIAAYFHASNGEEDGYRKILALIRHQNAINFHENSQEANERLHFENKSVWKNKLISRAFSSHELGKAVGKEDAVHLVIKSGVGARLLKARLKQLQLIQSKEMTDNA